jgi:OOP family OmpA-OmpF porin
MNKSLLLLTMISASYTTITIAQDQDQEYYAGLAIGRSSADVTEISRQDVLDTGFTSISGFQSGSSKSDTSWRIFGGYRLNPNVAAELFYANLGKFSREASGTGVAASSSTLNFALNSNLKITGFGAAALVGLPLTEQLSVFAKPGLIYWMAKRTDSITAGTATQNSSTDKNGTSPSFGVGISYAFTDKLSARLEGERYFDVGDKNTTGKSNVDMLGLSLQFTP